MLTVLNPGAFQIVTPVIRHQLLNQCLDSFTGDDGEHPVACCSLGVSKVTD